MRNAFLDKAIADTLERVVAKCRNAAREWQNLAAIDLGDGGDKEAASRSEALDWIAQAIEDDEIAPRRSGVGGLPTETLISSHNAEAANGDK